MTNIILNIVLIAIIPLLFTGVIKRVKSFWGGRKGPRFYQPFRDCARLLRKGEVISNVTSKLFRFAPSIALASTLTAAITVPMAGQTAIISFNGDFVVFAYLLALGRFFTVIGAMDTGSSFEGMGCSREVIFASFVEPGFFIIMGSFSYFSGYQSFSAIFRALHCLSSPIGVLLFLIAAVGLFIMLLAEGCRIPVDDPGTHLELTMIHEVMVLDNSGPDLAFIFYTNALKMFLIAALIAGIILPPWLTLFYSFCLFLSIVGMLAIIVGITESFMARLRLTHVPQLLFFITAIGVIIFFIIVMELNKII